MNQQTVDMFIVANQKYFPADKMMLLKDKLNTVSEEKFAVVSSIGLKDPTTVLIISLFFGSFGIDRFMIGNAGLGVLKLLTAGCCGIMTIVDWFIISKKTKETNFSKLMAVL